MTLGPDGRLLALPDRPEPTSPTLLVAPVTDALKTISDQGLVKDAVDRDGTWRIVAYELDAATCAMLAKVGDVRVELIYQGVIDMGSSWEIRQI